MTPEDQVVISVLLPDRVGILRAVTRVILDFQGNIGGIRQSIVDGFFSLTFTAALARPADPATIRQALEHQLGAEAAVAVRPVTQTPLPFPPFCLTDSAFSTEEHLQSTAQDLSGEQFTLNSNTQTFKAHTCINNFLW